MGRISTYTPEIGERICELVRTQPLRRVCLADDMPAEGTVYGWIASVPEFAESYARARQARAHSRAEDIDEVTDQIRRGELDPTSGRVVIDAMKWQASKEAPRVFGDKLELAGNAEQPLTVLVQRKAGEPESTP